MEIKCLHKPIILEPNPVRQKHNSSKLTGLCSCLTGLGSKLIVCVSA